MIKKQTYFATWPQRTFKTQNIGSFDYKYTSTANTARVLYRSVYDWVRTQAKGKCYYSIIPTIWYTPLIQSHRPNWVITTQTYKACSFNSSIQSSKYVYCSVNCKSTFYIRKSQTPITDSYIAISRKKRKVWLWIITQWFLSCSKKAIRNYFLKHFSVGLVILTPEPRFISNFIIVSPKLLNWLYWNLVHSYLFGRDVYSALPKFLQNHRADYNKIWYISSS